jgi:hypothetical protein
MSYLSSFPRLLIWRLTSRGFCSELNLLLFAILYCKQEGIDFALASRRWNSAHKAGWSDYFEPFCAEVDSAIFLLDRVRSKNSAVIKALSAGKRAAFRWKLDRHVLFNRDVWNNLWTREFVERRFDCLGGDDDCYSACRKVLANIWRFNSQTQRAISELTQSVRPDGEPYFTLHIRRGDKIEEASYVPLEKYVECAARASSKPLRHCHVMTDDYNIVLELRRTFPDLNVFTLCKPSSSGHDQKRFNKCAPEIRKDSTVTLLTELSMAAEGAFFVGTYSSNIARFVALLRGRESTHSVDIPFTMTY